MKKINLCLLIFWMIFIFIFSNQDSIQSSHLSDTFIEKTVQVTQKDTSEEKIEEMIHKTTNFVRKNAHFIEYLILGILMFRVLREYDLFKPNLFLYTLLFCMLYASSDEIHQLFVSGRSGQITDVLIDSCGSLFGIYFYQIFKKNK